MPLNIRLSPLEILAQVTDAEPSFVVVDETFVRVTAALGNQTPSVRAVIYAGSGAPVNGTVSYEGLISEGPAIDDANISGDALFGLLYTGGTTAASKGVMLTHTNICANAYNVALAIEYTERDIYLHAAPMFHVAKAA